MKSLRKNYSNWLIIYIGSLNLELIFDRLQDFTYTYFPVTFQKVACYSSNFLSYFVIIPTKNTVFYLKKSIQSDLSLKQISSTCQCLQWIFSTDFSIVILFCVITPQVATQLSSECWIPSCTLWCTHTTCWLPLALRCSGTSGGRNTSQRYRW